MTSDRPEYIVVYRFPENPVPGVVNYRDPVLLIRGLEELHAKHVSKATITVHRRGYAVEYITLQFDRDEEANNG